MSSLTDALLFSATGLAAGLAAHAAFLRMPDAWLLDYDQLEAPAGFARRRAFPLLPQGLMLMVMTALLYARIPAVAASGWHRAAAVLAVPALLLILVADWKTRIIPDQLTLMLLLPGLLEAFGDALAGTPWPAAFGFPVLAGLAAGGALLAVGLIGQWLMRREAMGMGDVKMIAATAFMVGWSHLLQLVMLSFLAAAIVAVPLLVRLRLAGRQTEVQAEVRAEAQPDVQAEVQADVQTVVQAETAEADPADDPSAMAFGPFIAIAALLLYLFPTQIDQLVQAYWSMLLR